jgi:hypothetical protein
MATTACIHCGGRFDTPTGAPCPACSEWLDLPCRVPGCPCQTLEEKEGTEGGHAHPL